MQRFSHIGVILLGGSLGVCARATLSVIWTAWGMTLIINVVGAFLLGLLITALGQETGWQNLLRLGLGTGLLGGFTTYSTFSLEIVELLQTTPWLGVTYALISLAFGIAAALLGIWLAAQFKPASSEATR